MAFRYYKANADEVPETAPYTAAIFIGKSAFLKALDTVSFEGFAEIPEGAYTSINNALREMRLREMEEQKNSRVTDEESFRAAVLLAQAQILAKVNKDNG